MSKGTIYTRTTNNALQYSDSGEACVELFSKIGASSVEEAKRYFKSAWSDNRETATQILFWARNARNGAGRRDVSLSILENYSDAFIADNINQLVNAGYYKDLNRFSTNDRALQFWANKIKEKDGLACKWAPRDGEVAKQLKTILGFTNKQYRVWIKIHSHTIEQYMAQKKEVGASDFNWVPGKAMQKYTKAFTRKYETEFTKWKDSKESKANASALWPHDVVKLLNTDAVVAEKQWDNLPNFIGNDAKIFPMIDTSSSMTCGANNGSAGVRCLDIAVALGMYIAERNESSFKNMFLTFNTTPQICSINPKLSFEKRLYSVYSAPWGGSTDFEKAYDLLLQSAKMFNVEKEKMPTIILVLSDMQFNEASRKVVHLENIKAKFNEAGYEMPKLIFWNLNAHEGSPAKSTDKNVGLVSGYSPSIMKSILKGEVITPYELMMETLKDIELNFSNLPQVLEL